MTFTHLLNKPLYKNSVSVLKLIGLTTALTACQSITDTPTTDSAQTSKSAPSSADSLTPRNLSPGECGLFIWAGEARSFILFSQNGQSAVFAKDGREIPLTPTPADISGDLYGQIPVQNFTDTQGVTYSLALSTEDNIDGGIRYSSGTWRYKDKDGWDVLQPVYGLSTCQLAT